ncbi:hypothetical protein HDU79_005460 [Rhizoclosmatium sp. JEL0117]|nr:hypothetical protein HDU79_005460 [Rhizoclosmatium sp. JEL0117]
MNLARIASCSIVFSNPQQSSSEAAPDILYSFPPSTDVAAVERQAGLAQAINSVAKAFAPSKQVSVVKSLKHVLLMLQPEPGFWIILKVRLGSTLSATAPRVIQYLPNSVNYESLKALLPRMYQRFLLLHNTFQSHTPLSTLIPKLDGLFSSYIDTLSIPSLDTTDAINAPTSLPLPPLAHLQTLQTLHTLKTQLSSILGSPNNTIEIILLYTHYHVPITGPLPSRFLPLYQYLTDPSTGVSCGDGGIVGMVKEKGVGVVRSISAGRKLMVSEEPRSSTSMKDRVSGGDSKGFTGFLVGPEEGDDVVDEWGGAKTIWIKRDGSDDVMEPWRCLVYQYNEDTTLTFLIPPSTPTPKTQPDLLHNTFQKSLQTLLTPISTLLSNHLATPPHPHLPHLLATNIPLNTITTTWTPQASTPSLLATVSSIHTDLAREDVSEVFVKSYSDGWVSGRKRVGAGGEVIVYVPGSGEEGWVSGGGGGGAKAVPSSAATAVPGPSGVTAASALTAAASKKAGGFNVAMIAQLALEKKRGQMKYVAKMNKENLLKDKALYRAEREINLNHFRELMNVFQQHGSKSMTMKDFKESFGQVLGEGLSEEQMGLLFMKIDANTDNAVDWDEFSTFMLLRAERQTKMLEEASTSLFEDNPMSPTPKIHTPHHESITSILFLEQHRKFVTASREGTVCFWSDKFRLQKCYLNVTSILQLDGREVMKQLGNHKNNPLMDREAPWIHDMIFMKPLAKYAIASDDHEITLYNSTTMQGKLRFDLKDSCALSLDFWYDADNPDAETCALYFGTDLGYVYTVNIVNSSFVNKNENTKNKCVTIVMDTFGRGTTKGMGTMVRRKAHDNWVGKVKYYHDWHAVVSCSIDPLASLVVAVQDGKNSWSYFSAPVNHGVNTFVYSRFPVALITGGTDHQLRVWNPHRLKNPMASFKGHASPIIDLQVNELNGQVISLSVDNVIKVWDIRKQICIQTLFDRAFIGTDDGLNHIFFMSAKLYALARSVSEYSLKGKETVKATSKVPQAARSHDFPLRAAIYNPTFKQVVTACDGGVINVWDALSGVHIFKFSETHGKSELTACAFDLGYRKLITGARDGTIYIWNFHNGQKIKELVKGDSCEVTEILQIEMHATKYIIAVGWNRKVAIFLDDPDSDKDFAYSIYPKHASENPHWHADDIMCLSFAQPNILATASFDGGIILSNVQSGHMLKKLKWPDQEVAAINKSIEKVVFLETRMTNNQAADLVTAGGDGMIRWWRTCESELMWEMNGVKGREGESIYSMITNPSNSILITGDTQGWITIYNIKETCIDGRENITVPIVLVQFRAHTRCIVSLNVFDTNIVTACTDGTSRLFTSHGKFIGTFGQEHVWDITEPANPPIPPDVLELATKEEPKKPAPDSSASTNAAKNRFRRASFQVMQEIRGSKPNSAEMLNPDSAVNGASLGILGSRKSSAASNADMEMEGVLSPSSRQLSLSNFSDIIMSPTAVLSPQESASELMPLPPPAPVPAAAAEETAAARRGSLYNIPKRQQSMRRQSIDSQDVGDSCPWKNRNLRTPDLLQTSYRTWYGKSQYAKDYLDREKRKEKKPPKGAQGREEAKLMVEKVSVAYHSLYPTSINDFSDNLHVVATLPVVAQLISKTKSEKTVPLKEEPSQAVNRNKSVKDSTNLGIHTAEEIHGKATPAINKTVKLVKRLTTPAIRELLLDSDIETKKEAVKDYLFGL